MGNQIRNPKSFNTVRFSNRNERLKKQQKQRVLILAMLAVIALLILSLVVFSVCAVVSSIANKASNVKDPDQNPAPSGSIVYREMTELANKVRTGELILVNKNYAYSFPSSPTQGFINLKTAERATINGRNTYQIYTKASTLPMQSEAFSAFETMMRDYYMQTEDGSVTVREVYRSAETQENMNTSVKAGYSDHHTGYLINLTNFDETSLPADHWVYQNCHKYGFVVRYPSDKSAKTGVDNYREAIRYVGVAHATYMKNNNLCMEEYLNVLKSFTLNAPLTVSCDNGNRYQIYYVSVNAGDTVVQFAVPSNYSYEISGDNVGGLIVTVNLNDPIA